ncbi:MAG: FAD-binding and (Fe-S)-binding domain-containing protein, partial [Gemmataceae bacterium]
FRGAWQTDTVARQLFARDASILALTPLAVVTPLDEADLQILLSYCHAHSISVAARGAGTGMAGQSLTTGIVIDMMPNFRQILAIDADTVRVQPGVTLEQLQAALAPLGRRLAPDLLTRQATIGGMIATNASGPNVARRGDLREAVVRLRVVWDDGSAERIGLGLEPLAPRTVEIRASLALLLSEAHDLIQNHRRPKYEHAGYRLDNVHSRQGWDLARLLVGAEGTLGIVTEATLRTVPIPLVVRRWVLGFPTLDRATRAVTELLGFDAIVSADVYDQRLLAAVPMAQSWVNAGVGAVVVVCVETETEAAAEKAVESIARRLSVAGHAIVPLVPPGTADEALGEFARQAQGGLGSVRRGRRPTSWLDDAAVPPVRVPEYLAAVQELLRTHDLVATVFIQGLSGHVQVRPLIDLSDEADRARLWPLAEEVHTLVRKLGGTLAGQYGLGRLRLPWAERQAGDLWPLYREVKRIFDPQGILNPGQMPTADPSQPAWPLCAPLVSDRTPLLVWATPPEQEAAKCTRCAECRTTAPGGRMCPAYRTTGQESSSPRAMAELMQMTNADATSAAARTVAEACVQCRMCQTGCPSGVDIPRLMIEARAALVAERGFDRSDAFFARLEGWIGFTSTMAFTTNEILSRRLTRWLLEKFIGLDRQRRLHRFTHRTYLRRAWREGRTRRPPSVPGVPRIAYFVDTFANANDPSLGRATVQVFEHHGIATYVPWKQRASGFAALSQGDVETARDLARYNLRTFGDLALDGYTIVCTEPTAALMLKEEYPRLVPGAEADAVAGATTEFTQLLSQWQSAGSLKTDFQSLNLQIAHHVPCHIKALGDVHSPAL